jgi:hypothetical protein
MKVQHWAGTLGAVATLLAVAGAADAYEIRAFAAASRKATLEDFTPKLDRAENRANKFYAEQYSFAFEMEDGYGFWFQIVLSNMGLANGRGAVLAHFTPKGGQKIKSETGFGRDRWSYKTDGRNIEITLGENRFRGDGTTWSVTLKNDAFEAEGVVKNSVPAWRPGGGSAFYGAGAGSYYDMTILTPRGTFEGDVTVKATGEKHHVKGLAFGDNSAINVAPNLQAHSWIRMRTVTGKYTLSVTAFQTTEQYGSSWVGWFFIASDKRMVAFGVNPSIDLAEFERDEKTGYDVPKVVLLSGATGIDGFVAGIKGTKRTKRQDRLASLDKLEAAVASKLVKPVVFTYDSSFELQFKDGTDVRSYKGKASYSYEQMNK